MSFWDLKFIKCDKYKIAIFLSPRIGSTTLFKTICDINYGGHVQRDKRIEMCREHIVESPPSDYKKYAFVRNPYSRVYSTFIFQCAIRRSSNPMSFHEFIKKYVINSKKLRKHKLLMPFKNILKLLPEDTKLCRFENFSPELKSILDENEIKYEEIIHSNKSRLNSYSKNSYENDYRNEEKFIIRCVYQWDLEKLNYTFDSYGDLPLVRYLKK